MRRLTPLLAAASVLAVLAGPAQAADYSGYVSVGRGPAEVGVQGNAWTLVFRESVRGRVPYRVCVGYLERRGIRRCYDRRTNSRGRSSIFAARFVNDRGGTGRWRARWYVGGKSVDSWSFRVRSEGV